MIFLGLGLVFSLLTLLATRRQLTSVFVFLLVTTWAYLAPPTLAFGFTGLPLLILATLVIISADLLTQGQRDNPARPHLIAATALYVVALLVVPIVTTWGFFHADEYKSLAGTIEEKTFSTEIPPLESTEAQQVDEPLAQKLAQAKLNNEKALGSTFQIGEMYKQDIGGRLYWVGPLTPRSTFMAWKTRSTGAPGYARVSVSNPDDVAIVTKLPDGSPMSLVYTDNAILGHDLNRYLYGQGYAHRGRTSFTMEIAPDGRPYYIVTAFRNAIGFGGPVATGIIKLDPQTGAHQFQPVGKTEAWIDLVQPEEFALSRIHDVGQYPHGWALSSRDKTMPTPGTTVVYGADGKAYYYTGIQSVGADRGTLGFALSDTRTGKITMYRQAGITEDEGQSAAAGLYQAEEYAAMEPVPYAVGSTPTYFMPMKNNAGYVNAYVFMALDNAQVYGKGKTVQDALRDYHRALAGRGNQFAAEGAAVQMDSITGTASRWTAVQDEYYLMVSDERHRTFIVPAPLSPEAPNTREGDQVRVWFQPGTGSVVHATRYDNLSLLLEPSGRQALVEARSDSVRNDDRAERAGQNADATWESLPDTARARIAREAVHSSR